MAMSRKRRRWIAGAAGGAMLAGGVYLALGPAAAWIVDSAADNARVWRLGRITLDGVTGGWLGDLRAEHVEIADEDGVWIEANNVELKWRPQDLLAGGVRLEVAHAESLIVTRRPILTERRPSSGTNFDIRLDDVQVARIYIGEGVVGEAAELRADLSLRIEDERLLGLDAEVRRLDSDEDRLIAYYRPDDPESLLIHLDLESAPGGVIARAVGVGEQGLRATARGERAEGGGANVGFSARIGEETQIVDGLVNWTPERWRITQVEAHLDRLPALETLARRIGPSVTLTGAGDQGGAFEVRAETPFFAVTLNGATDEEFNLVGAARFVATTERLSDIARESPFELGPARLEGELRSARGTTAIQGTLDAQGLQVFGRTGRFTGPVRAALMRERFQLDGDLRAAENSAPLFANARLRTEMEYDRRTGRFELDRAEIAGDAVQVSAQGWTTRGDGEYSGEWRARRLGVFVDDLAGQAAGRWRAFTEEQDNDTIWTIAVDGAGSGIGGRPEVVAQLLGAAPRLDARLHYENGGITVSHARVDGAQLRAGATGRIVQGQADLALEASARGPLDLGGAEISGAVDATGRLTGRIARPTLSARGALTSFAAGGVVVAQPVLDFTLAPTGNGYAGRAEVVGSAQGRPLNATANVAINGDALGLSNLDGQWGALAAQGSATFASAGVSANLDVNGSIEGLVPGATGRLAGTLGLTPERLVLDAQIMDARSGELRVRAATLHAEGPLDAIAARFDMRGRLRQAPLAFEGTALADLTGDATVRIEGRGELADAPVFTRAPMTATWREGGVDASLNVAMGDGVLEAQWQERGRAVSGSAQVEQAPLAPLAAIWGERASGRIDGTVTLANDGRGLSGAANVTMSDARLAGRQRGTLDMRIVGDLDPGRLQATVDATSSEGLVAHFEADAPVTTSVDPIRIALAPERRGRATWTVTGPAQSLFAAARLQDQSLEGNLEGRGELEFGAGYLSGDGFIELVSGRFEDKLTGITLTDLNARIAMDERGVTIENFTAGGPGGGRLTATGGSANQREGRVTVTLNDMRVANRPEARATASGELTLVWEALQSSLTGQLNVQEASVDIAAHAEAGIPTLEVIEINRPGEEDEIAAEEAARDEERERRSTELNVAITAPGRVFTRGRGVDAEWSLDLRLQGTARNPQVFGTARAVRGTLALSGQPFEIDEARIQFNGDPMEAQVDIRATRDTADLTAIMRLTGTASDPEISFTSNPALPEDEILPQVLFGRSVEDLSGLEAAQLAASLAALSGRGGLDIIDSVRAAAGLDRFSVRQDEGGGFLVAGGRYLTRDVYVEVARTGLGEAQTTLEWTLRPRLVLITSFLSDGDQRVALRWRHESD